MKIYVASSWRTETQPIVVKHLRSVGHEVYDFRNPKPGNHGFSWKQAGDVSGPYNFLETLESEIANEGFALDKAALDWADGCLLLLPSGRSAHLEAGYAIGRGKRVAILLSNDKFEPELMYKLAGLVTMSWPAILDFFRAR
jgi:hypothetical protein